MIAELVMMGMGALLVIRYAVVTFADNQALDFLGERLAEVPNLPAKEKEVELRWIKMGLNEITGTSVMLRMLDLTTWRAEGWYEWLKREEEGK